MQQISVLIAAYNAESFIHRAIESLLQQSVLPFEIIIVNDCSSDNTKSVVEKIGAKSDLIKIIDLTKNGGPAKARNAGIKCAQGSWIAILDADDAVESNYIETLLETANNSDADILATNFCWFDVHKNTPNELGLDLKEEQILINKYQFVNGARPFCDEADYGLLKPVFRAEFLCQKEVYYPENLRHGEDFMIMMEALLVGARYLVIKKPLYLYTTRSSGMSKTVTAYKKMAHATLTFLKHSAVAGDEKMISLIKQRALSLRKLDAWMKFNEDRNGSNFFNLMFRSVSDVNYASYLFGDVRKKALHKLRKFDFR
jgi:succinoglycan biosynthesis protein ExoO